MFHRPCNFCKIGRNRLAGGLLSGGLLCLAACSQVPHHPSASTAPPSVAASRHATASGDSPVSAIITRSEQSTPLRNGDVSPPSHSQRTPITTIPGAIRRDALDSTPGSRIQTVRAESADQQVNTPTIVQPNPLELVNWSGESDHAPLQVPPGTENAALLRLDDLIALAMSNNPSLRQAEASARKAMGIRRQVGLYPNPTIGYMGQEMGDDGTAGMQGGFIGQTLVMGHKLSWNRSVADQEIQALLWQAESQRYRIRNDVRRQFYETLGAQERVQLAAELYRIVAAGLENTQTLYEVQQAALPDVLQAKVQLEEVQIIQRNADYQYDASWQQLAALVGIPSLNPTPLEPILYAEQPLRDRETAWAQIVAMSPQLRQAQAEVQRARARIGRERVQPIPNLEAQVAVMHMNVPDDNAASVMLGVPVPLFNANGGNIDRAVAELQRATANLRRTELSLQAQLADTFNRYQQALNRATTYRDEIVPAQSQTLELIQQGYPVQFDFLRLLTARRMFYEAKLAYLEAVIDLRRAEVALDGLLLSGGLDSVPDTSLDDGLRSSALMGQ